MDDLARTALRTAGGLAGAGLVGIAYAAFVERTWFTLRRFAVPALPPGAAPVRILQVSASRAAGCVRPGLERLLRPDAEEPGPLPHQPPRRRPGPTLDAARQGAARRLGQQGLGRPEQRSQDRADGGPRCRARGGDRYAKVAGPASTDVALTMGLVHAPYQRVLDAMVGDGASVVLAGHTHGGQLAVPLWGALVTNCDLDTRRAKGVSRWWPGAGTAGARGGAAPSSDAPEDAAWLHVSAGLGTSPYAPVRFACRPEATLLTLLARDS